MLSKIISTYKTFFNVKSVKMNYHLIKFDFSSGDGVYVFENKYYFLSFPYTEKEEVSKSELEFLPFSDENVFFSDLNDMIKYAEVMYMNDKYTNPKLKHTKKLLEKIEEKKKNLQQKQSFVELRSIINAESNLNNKEVIQEVQKLKSEEFNRFLKIYQEKFPEFSDSARIYHAMGLVHISMYYEKFFKKEDFLKGEDHCHKSIEYLSKAESFYLKDLLKTKGDVKLKIRQILASIYNAKCDINIKLYNITRDASYLKSAKTFFEKALI